MTTEEARDWMEQHPLCLLMPRIRNLRAPAPSFVEACLGERNEALPPEAVERAQALIQPLLNAGSLVMLNLLGGPGAEPDFLVQVEILPWVIALAADREWKLPPRTTGARQVTRLAHDLWKALEKDGPMTPAEAREKLGGELTEAAVLHALQELWRSLRVSPVGLPIEAARWELMQQHHRQALQAGLAASQVTALSLLVSTYLQSVYAAAEEEIEEFLSPLASQSRIRESVRGLTATRQVRLETFGTRSLCLLEGALESLELAAGPTQEGALAPAAELETAEQQTSSGSRREEKRELDVTSGVAPTRSKPEERRKPGLKPGFKPGFKPGRRQASGRRPESAREQRPERRREQSGWRKLSSEELRLEGGQERGKGWERPMRRNSGFSRPWPSKDREAAAPEQHGQEAEQGRDRPRRAEFKPGRFGGKFQGKPNKGRPFRSGGEQRKGWERPKRRFSGSSQPWSPKDRGGFGADQRSGRAEGRDDTPRREFKSPRYEGKPKGGFKGRPYRGDGEQAGRSGKKFGKSFGGPGRFRPERSRQKGLPEGAPKGWKKPEGETTGRPDKPWLRREDRRPFPSGSSGRYSKPFGSARSSSGKSSAASPARTGKPWQGGKGDWKKKGGKGFGAKKAPGSFAGAAKGFSRKKGPRVNRKASEEAGGE